jgi:hypothetical protein
MDIESKINYLISLCGDMRNQFDIQSIQSNKLKFAVEVKETEVDKDILL